MSYNLTCYISSAISFFLDAGLDHAHEKDSELDGADVKEFFRTGGGKKFYMNRSRNILNGSDHPLQGETKNLPRTVTM